MHTTLIDAATLAQHLTDPAWVILDCRHDLLNPDAGRDGYAIGHIQNAQFAGIDDHLSGAQVGADGKFHGRHPLPDRAALIETLRGWGIDDHSQVVAYDAHGGMYAARLWWLLRWIGHPARGGAGRRPGRMAVAGTAAGDAGGVAPARPHRREADADQNRDRGRGGRQSAQPRPHRRRRPRAGPLSRRERNHRPGRRHIPGAKSRFFKDNLNPDGRFKTAAQLKLDWAPVIELAPAAIMQCGSGVTACHNLLALEVAGMSGAALYPGSWSEWCADPARPVATGA